MTLNEETRRGYVISSEMKKVWAVQLELLSKLLEVCSKHNLKIWADGGTLLGAVREKGYIPWDDDIDLVMFREDYNKLIEIGPKEFKAPYFFQNAYTEKRYFRGHSQLRMDGTAAILLPEIDLRFHQGIFIDIFVIDAMPKDKNYLINAIKKGEWLRALMTHAALPLTLCTPRVFLKRVFAKLYFSFFSFTKCFMKFERIYSMFEGELADEFSSPEFTPALSFIIKRKREWYDETLFVPFEDIKIPVPSGYDKILSQHYGDNYMTPVKAPSMHGGVIFDTARSYTEVLKDIKSGKINIIR